MNRSHTKKENQNGSFFNTGWKRSWIAFGISVGIGALLILLAALAAKLTPDPGSWILPLAIVAAVLTYLAAGMVGAKLRPDAPLAAGTVNGLLLSALSLALSLLVRKTATALPAYATALLHAGMILLSLLGAYLSLLKGRKPKRKKRKRG